MFTEEAEFSLPALTPVYGDELLGDMAGVLTGMTVNETNDYFIRMHAWWALASGSRGSNASTSSCTPGVDGKPR